MPRRAGRLAQEADDQLEEYTGRSSAVWMQDTRDAIRKHPFAAIVLAIGLGYLVGKLK